MAIDHWGEGVTLGLPHVVQQEVSRNRKIAKVKGR